ncbi:hypothetical protein SEA_RASPUTIA_125 [Microbacterium phage Rasputia]|nr:hypothetical protein SEA_RASPUTIA_125 [Microbacterium phage Rasputia]
MTDKNWEPTEEQKRIVDTYGEFFNNTGGNDPLDLLTRLHREEYLVSTNMPVAMLAMAQLAQVNLIRTLENEGKLPK